MQSYGGRVNPKGTHRSLRRETRFRWKGVMDSPFWVTDGASGENNRERGFPGPPAVCLELSSHDNPKRFSLGPRIASQRAKDCASVSPSGSFSFHPKEPMKLTDRECTSKGIRPGREFKHDLAQLSLLTDVKSPERSRNLSRVTQLVSWCSSHPQTHHAAWKHYDITALWYLQSASCGSRSCSPLTAVWDTPHVLLVPRQQPGLAAGQIETAPQHQATPVLLWGGCDFAFLGCLNHDNPSSHSQQDKVSLWDTGSLMTSGTGPDNHQIQEYQGPWITLTAPGNAVILPSRCSLFSWVYLLIYCGSTVASQSVVLGPVGFSLSGSLLKK